MTNGTSFMRRRCHLQPRAVLILSCCAAALLALALRSAAQGHPPVFFYLACPQEEAETPDPLPIQRVTVPPDQVSTELERARQGMLVQLSREDFEGRVRRAAEAGEAVKRPPRLVEARYQAALEDTALVGTAQWTVINPARAAGILPVQPLNLALRRFKVEKTDALLGELDGKNLALLVPKPGRRRVTLDWSARGDLESGDLRFKLDVPLCALSSFELALPADRIVEVSRRDKCLLSGPRTAAAREHRLWRL